MDSTRINQPDSLAMNDLVEVAARFLVRFSEPASLQRLLAAHTPDSTGHCATCRTISGAAPWPCQLHAIAKHALRAPTPG
ncbi:MAG: hypothetical protein JO100_10965 [Pseudonocardia sp.]|nr:hypothetical protein [Pseudonocardia sp.]